MGSRIREKPERLFEVFMEIAKPAGAGEVPFVVQQFPEDYHDKEALAMVPKFAFPCETDASTVDHFSFVLTDVDSYFRFGYCRHATGHQTCLCIVSWLPWFEIFYKLLDLLAELTNRSETSNVTDFLQAAYDHEVPASKVPVTIVANEEMFNFTAPDPNILPSIPGSRNLTEYYNAVDTNNMMAIFASMLQERRVYMTSKKLSRLTSCIFAAEALLYPMHWQHIFIPVLPAYLIEYVSSPIPYLIGLHGNMLPKIKEHRVDVADAVIVDLDAGTVASEYDDLGSLPEDVTNSLKKDLKSETLKISMLKTGDAISMAFLKALVKLIGGYRDALKFRPGVPITFDPNAFVRSRSSQTTRAYLESMLSLQIFMQFIHGRLEILNAGIGFRDIFEQQATLYADKLNSQTRYDKWLDMAKKKGKNGFMGVKVKAAPMMSTAVNSLKEQSKKAMTKISALGDNEDKKGSNFKASGGIVHRKQGRERPPSTLDGSKKPKSARPPRPPPPTNRMSKADSLMRTPSSEKDESHDDSQLRLSYHTMDMSLMGDTDIQAAMLRSASAEVLNSNPEVGGYSSTPSTSSLDDAEGEIIPFDNLDNDSDDGGVILVAPDLEPNTDDAPTEDHLIQPVAPPRTKRKSPKPSPSASPSVNTGRSRPAAMVLPASSGPTAPQIPAPPKPIPRQSSLRKSNVGAGLGAGPAAVMVPEAPPLIKFDSSESEADMFDPLAGAVRLQGQGSSADASRSQSSASPQMSDVLMDDEYGDETGVQLRGLERNRESRSSLSRQKAFRRESPMVPLRPSYKDDDSTDNYSSSATSTPQRHITPDKDDDDDLFDPLSAGISELSAGETTAASSSPSSSPLHQGADKGSTNSGSQLLMQEWSLASLSKGPILKLPPGHSRSTTSMLATNPFILHQQQQQQQRQMAFSMHNTARTSPGSTTGPRYPSNPAPRSPNPFHYYSLAYTGSGPPPPPNRLPTSFISRFSQPQPQQPSAAPHALYGSSPGGAVGQAQGPQSGNPFHGRTTSPNTTLSPQPAPLAPSTNRSVSPSQGLSRGPVVAAASSGKSQADLLSDLIGIDFGSGVGQAQQQQQTISGGQQQQQQQQQQSHQQHRWETFD